MADTYSIDAQMRCVQREIDKREQVYTRLANEGRMNKFHAAHEIATMRAVLQTLMQVATQAQPRVSRGPTRR